MRRTDTVSPDHLTDPDGEQLSIGIIGFGQLARNYYSPVLRNMGPGLRVSVADPLEDSRECAKRLFADVRTYRDFRDLLDQESLQALLVSAPPSRHLEIWEAARLHQLPVFMEKPFPMVDDLERIDTAQPGWDQLMINFNRRFWPAYRFMRECIDEGVLGKVVRARFVLHVNAEKWSGVTDHRILQEEGGVLQDLGSHVLDLVSFTLQQEPLDLSAEVYGTGPLDRRIDLSLRYTDALMVECSLAYGRSNRESVLIEGEDASLLLRDPNFVCWLNRRPTSLTRLAQGIVDLSAIGYRGIFRGKSMLRYSIGEALVNFFGNIGTNKAFNPGLEDGLQVTRQLKSVMQALEVQSH